MTDQLHHANRTADRNAVAGPVRIPALHYITSFVGMGPMPLTQIVPCRGLIDEANRVGQARPPGTLTHAEDSLRRRVETATNTWLDKQCTSQIEPLIGRIKGTHAEINFFEHQLQHVDDKPYVGIHGEFLTKNEAENEHRDAQHDIAAATRNGDIRHRRTSVKDKRTVRRLIALDFPILLFLMLKFLNVGLTTFWQTPGGIFKAITAAVFAGLGTVGIALGMKMFGKRHRPYKSRTGSWSIPREAKPLVLFELGLAVAVILAVACAMAWRFVLDGREASGDFMLTLFMAVLFALITTAVAYLAYMSEFSDGSLETDRAEHLGTQLDGTARNREALQGKIKLLTEEAGRLIAQLQRQLQATRAQAIQRVIGSKQDTAMRYARAVHQQTGIGGELPEPRLDISRLDLAHQQALQLDAYQFELESGLELSTSEGKELQ